MRVEVPSSEIASRKISNGDFQEFVDAGGYQNRKLWSDSGWQFIQESKIDAPPFWSRRDGGWQYEWIVRIDAASARLARLRESH